MSKGITKGYFLARIPQSSKSNIAFVCRARHLKKKMVVQTPRLRIEEIASGISRLGISTGDQEKIMWNFQVF